MPTGIYTSYKIGEESYASYILGTSIEKIKKAVDLRGLGEMLDSSICDIAVIEDYSLLSDCEFKNRLPEIIHTWCYLSLIAFNSGGLSIQEILSDRGIIHELTHILHIGETSETNIKGVKHRLRLLKKIVVGIYDPV